MSTSIENMIVEMKFDNSTFQKGVSTTLASLGSLQKGLGLLSGWSGVKPLVDGVGGFGSSLRNLIPSIDGISTKMVALGTIGVTALSKLTSSAIDFAGRMSKQLLGINAMNDGFDDYNKKLTSVETVMNATGKSMDYVGKRFEKLDEYADDTVYSMDDMTSAFAKFSNAGVDLDKSVIAIQGIGNATAYAGQGSSEAALAYRNFSDAISKGFLGGGDFLSLKNSNVITKQFKEEMIKAGIAAGTLRKEADGTFTTLGEGASRAGVSAAELFNVLGETQWANVDVLMGTLEKFGDETTTLGKKASKSARDVKTLPMLFETLKAQAGTGWTKTFEIVVGDLKEAKKLWTGVADYIGGILGSMADARNTMFQVWKDDGGRDALLNSFANIAQAIEGVVKPIGDAFREVFGGLSGGALADATKAFERFTKALIPSKDTAQAIKSVFVGVFSVLKVGVAIVSGLVRYFVDFAVLLSGLIAPVFRFVGAVVELGNKTQILDKLAGGISKIFDGIIAARRKVMEPLIDFIGSFIDIFTQLIQNGPQAAIDQAGKAFSKLKSFAGVLLNAIISPFEKLGSLATLVWGQITDGVSALLDKMGPTGDKIRELGSSIASIFDGLKAKMAPLGAAFQRTFGALGNLFSSIKDRVADAFSGLSGGVDTGGLSSLAGTFASLGSSIKSGFGSAISVVTSGLQKVLDLATKVSNKLAGAFSGGGASAAASSAGSSASAGAAQSLSKMQQASAKMKAIWADSAKTMSPVMERLENMANGFSEVFKGLGSSLGNFLKDASFQDILEVIKTGALISFVMDFKKMTKSFGALADSFGGVLDGLGESLNAFALAVKANAIRSIAISIAILVGALFALSLIDPQKLGNGLAALASVMAMMTTSFIAMTKAIDPKSQVSMLGMAAALVGMSLAILILTKAVEKFGNMDQSVLIQGGIAIAAAIALLTGAAVAMAKTGADKHLVGMAFSLLILSVALLALSKPIELYSKMNIVEFAYGLGLMAGTIAILGMAMSKLQTQIGGAAALLVASVALLILGNTLKKLGDMSMGDTLQALILMGVALAVITVAMGAMQNLILGAAALIVFSIGLEMFVKVLMKFNELNFGDIIGGILKIGLAALLLSALSGILIAAATGMAVFGAAVLIFGLGLALVGVGIAGIVMGLQFVMDQGDALFKTFQELMGSFFETLKLFVTHLGELAVHILETIRGLFPEVGKTITEFIKMLAQIVMDNATTFVDAMVHLIKEALRGIREVAPDFAKTGIKLIMSFLKAVRSKISQLTEVAADIMIRFLKKLKDKAPDLVDAGVDLIAALIRGLGKNAVKLANAAADALIDFLDGLADAIDKKAPRIREEGGKVVKAFIKAITDGIRDAGGAIKDAIGDMADSFTGFMGKAWDKIKGSPGKPAYDAGHDVILAIAKGMVDNKRDLYRSANDTALAGADALRTAFTGILNEDVDVDPTITPVLDLTKVQREAARMGEMLGASAIDPTVDYRNATGIAEMRARFNADQQEAAKLSGPEKIEFNQTITAPKALKTSDIYRATKSQLAMAKEELKVS